MLRFESRPGWARRVGSSLLLLALGCEDSDAPNTAEQPVNVPQADAGAGPDFGGNPDVPGAGNSGAPGAGTATGGSQPDAGFSPPPAQGGDAAAQPDGVDASGAPGQPPTETDSGQPPAGGNEVVCPSTPLAPGDYPRTVSVGGQTRRYTLHVPRNYTGESAVPLLTDWHPILGDGQGQRRLSGFEAVSDREGFLVVWADGIDGAWNVGECCTLSREVDDVAFAREIVAQVSSEACVDPSRVYAAGFSMGGGMSYKLACDAADLIAAVAPSAFQLFTEDQWPCEPSRPISVLMFNGGFDFVVPPSGGASRPPNGLNVVNQFLGTEATFEKWAQLNGCSGEPKTDGQCRTYDACSAGVEVTLCLNPFGGHAAGDAEVAWSTLQRFTLP